MQMKIVSGAGLAAAAIALAISGAALTPAQAKQAAVHCMGINSCKGTSACKSASNACKGQNTCKGQGFLLEEIRQGLHQLAARSADPVRPLPAERGAVLLHGDGACRARTPQGFGLGLRRLLSGDSRAPQPVDWFEIISENFMVPGGRPLATLDENPRRLSRAHARRVALSRLDRSARFRLSARAEKTGGASRAGADFRPSRLDRRRRRQSPRSPARALYAGNPRPLRRARRARPGFSRPPHRRWKIPRPMSPSPATEMAEASFSPNWRAAPIACCCSTSTMSLSPASTTVSTRRSIWRKSRTIEWRRSIWPATSDLAAHKIDTHDHPVCEEVWALLCPCAPRIRRRYRR